LDTRLELGPGLTVFAGANGQGKSNLLEAAYLLAIAKSPRASVDREMVNWEIAEKGGHTQVLGVGREADVTTQAQLDIDVAPPGGLLGNGNGAPFRKSLRVNGIIRTAAEFVGKLNVVFFEAADLQLVLGGPADRRRFLDILISQTDPAYLKAIQRYSRVVMQRNQLLRRLREDQAGEDELQFWDDRLAVEGSVIVDRRRKTVGELTAHATEAHDALAGGAEQLGVQYRPRLTAESDGDPLSEYGNMPADRLSALISESLQRVRGREIAQGFTLIGPHRDDVLLTLNGQPADAFASRGQARSIALSLKLAEAATEAASTGRKPVMALDDGLSELDPGRRRLVLERVSKYEQILLTATEFEIVDRVYLEKASRYMVRSGKVSQA
jgi:DNA replication and repair protein RecF